MAKKELALINLDQFSIQQLPELQNKKEEQTEELEANKEVEETPIIYPDFGDQSETILQDIAEEPKVAENSWRNIYSEFFKEVGRNEFDAFFHWLSQNYNVPTKK